MNTMKRNEHLDFKFYLKIGPYWWIPRDLTLSNSVRVYIYIQYYTYILYRVCILYMLHLGHMYISSALIQISKQICIWKTLRWSPRLLLIIIQKQNWKFADSWQSSQALVFMNVKGNLRLMATRVVGQVSMLKKGMPV
jgi:hypothetical protein